MVLEEGVTFSVGAPASLENSIPGFYRACSRCGLGC